MVIKMNLIIGSHVSFNKDEQLVKSVKEAISYNANTFMFYTGAPQNTNRSELNLEKIKEADNLMEENNIDKSKVIVHAPYIINLANDTKSYDFSINFLKQEYQKKIKISKKSAKEKALKIMEEVGISYPEKRFKQYPFEFSGGMRQRIVIAIKYR